MKKLWRDTFLMHSETREYEKKVSEAEAIISDALKLYEKPYIAFSGGKDSIAMTHLILEQSPETFIYHHDQGVYMPSAIRKEIYSILRDSLQSRNFRVYPASRNFWYGILDELIEEGYDGVFVGLRKEEGVKRKLRIKEQKYLTAIPETWALQNWTWMDVWAYIVSHQLRYPSTYDKYAELVGWDKVRFHSFFDPSMQKYGCSNIDGVLMWRDKYGK